MENNYVNKKRAMRFKSVTNKFKNKLLKIERSNSNSVSSISKKTACFDESALLGMGQKMNSFSTKITPNNNLFFSIQNNLAIRSSTDLSIRDFKDKTTDINNICTNINISIDNANFSINNIENNNKTSSMQEINVKNSNIIKEPSENVNNQNIISFKGSNVETESNANNNKILSSIYQDYLANKSNSEIYSDNIKNESKLKKLNEYIDKNKILQYEYSKGCISGFSAYSYQNNEKINKNKLSININVNKGKSNDKNSNIHTINYFSLFCGDIKDEYDDLSKFLKNNFKDILLQESDIINNPQNAIKNSFAKCEINYINYFLKENNIQKTPEKTLELYNKFLKIQNCSIIILLNIDDFFYIGNIGNNISIISSNSSKKIEYLSRENITQEMYENLIKKKRKSLHSLLNFTITNENEVNDSKEHLNNSRLMNRNSKTNILNIISLNNIFTYNFIRIFPGKKLHDILTDYINKNINKLSKASKNTDNVQIQNRQSLKINNFIKDNEKKNKNNNMIIARRASLGPFFKISPKTKDYNPTKYYRNSCAQMSNNNKSQVITINTSCPDIISFKHKKRHDFIFIGNNAIFQKITYDKICKSIYDTMKKCIKKHRSFELFLGWVIKDIIKMCISIGINTNISCLFICFNPIKELYLKQDIEEIKNIIVPLCLTFTDKDNIDFYEDLLSANFIDVDKANNYYDFITQNLDKLNKSNEKLIEIDISKNNDNNNSKNKKVKKKCCCLFC